MPSITQHIPEPFVVALTGGIASGKTSVSDRFAALGVPVIDTDIIARELVEPGEPLLLAIANHFGPKILDAEGRLRRRILRERIFADKTERIWLEALLHPSIRAEARKRANKASHLYCLVVIPLLAENDVPDYVDRVLVVDVSEETQLARLMTRDDMTIEQAHSALSSQASRSDRLKLADDVLNNSGSLDALGDAIKNLDSKYTHLALRRGKAAY